jgi:hypothetical protein
MGDTYRKFKNGKREEKEENKKADKILPWSPVQFISGFSPFPLPME